MEDFDYDKKDIVNALRVAGICEDDSIFTHSNLGFFGKLKEARSREEYYRAFKEAIFEVIGINGTLVVPTFSYSFCWGKAFSKSTTPSVCGFFSEMVRLDPEAHRSNDPNFSVAAIGRYGRYFTENAPEHSFGRGSFWEKFLEKGGKFCNFNFDSASTFIHYVEKLVGVNYRYDKPFSGKMENDEKESTFYHFVFDHGKPNHAPDFTKFDRKAKELGLAKSVRLGKGSIVTITAENALNMIKEELKRNPEFLIKGPL